MAGLSDEAWAAIIEAAGRAPDDEAATRAELDAILFVEYPAFAYDAARWAAAAKRADRMLGASAPADSGVWRRKPKPKKKTGSPGLLETVEKLHRAQFAGAGDDVATERDLWAIEAIRRRWIALSLAARAVRRGNEAKRSPQWEWLIHRLCGVWLDRFHGELTVTVPWDGDDQPKGHAPKGPAIAFLSVCAAQALGAQPSPETIRKSMMRERRERANARELARRQARKAEKAD